MRSNNGSGNGSIQGRLITEIRRRIIAGEIQPGINISELALAEEFGVSRTPVREALLRLAQAGLVVAQPGRSTTVSSLDRRAVRDARAVVAAMHQVAVREAEAMAAAGLDGLLVTSPVTAPGMVERLARARERVDLAVVVDSETGLDALAAGVSADRPLGAVVGAAGFWSGGGGVGAGPCAF